MVLRSEGGTEGWSGARGGGVTLWDGVGVRLLRRQMRHMNVDFFLYFLTNNRFNGSPLVASCAVKIVPFAQILQCRRFIQSGSKGQSLFAELLCGRRSDVLSGILFFALQLGKKQAEVSL